jgi:hypothetical protein
MVLGGVCIIAVTFWLWQAPPRRKGAGWPWVAAAGAALLVGAVLF